MGSQIAAGSSLAISAMLPTTHDAVGYAALTFIEIGQIEKLGTNGAAFVKVEYQPLKGAKQKYKGSADFSALQPSIAIDAADAGQILMPVASDEGSQKLYSFRVTLQDGTKRYFLGRVVGSPEVPTTLTRCCWQRLRWRSAPGWCALIPWELQHQRQRHHQPCLSPQSAPRPVT